MRHRRRAQERTQPLEIERFANIKKAENPKIASHDHGGKERSSQTADANGERLSHTTRKHIETRHHLFQRNRWLDNSRYVALSISAHYFLGEAAGFGSAAGFTSAADFCRSVTAAESSSYSAGSFSRFATYLSPFLERSTRSTRLPSLDVTATSMAAVENPESTNLAAESSRTLSMNDCTLALSIFLPSVHQSWPPLV